MRHKNCHLGIEIFSKKYIVGSEFFLHYLNMVQVWYFGEDMND